jgi:hypothetical protein
MPSTWPCCFFWLHRPLARTSPAQPGLPVVGDAFARMHYLALASSKALSPMSLHISTTMNRNSIAQSALVPRNSILKRPGVKQVVNKMKSRPVRISVHFMSVVLSFW